MADNARTTVVAALTRMEREEGYSNIVIDNALEKNELSGRDRAFASALFYGVLERRLMLDYVLAHYSKNPIEKTNLMVLNTLRVALYQLMYMDRVPDSAVVNEAVKTVRIFKKDNASGFVNAVLRGFIRDGMQVTLPTDRLQRMELEYSCPQWIIKSLIKDYGLDNARAVLQSFLDSSGIALRVNTQKITAAELCERLREQGVEAAISPLCPDALTLRHSGGVRQLYGYEQGLFHIQDISSQLCVAALSPKSGERVLDVCAAPGGKAFTAAELMQDSGEVVACDLYEHKVELINSGAQRLGLQSLCAMVRDAKIYNPEMGEFDRVLCDLPCSGLGILGKKPEIRYKNVVFLDNLPSLQYDLLCSSSRYVKKGGRLVYSTCTLRQCENAQVAERFLQQNPDFAPAALPFDIEGGIDEPSHMKTVFPQLHNCDGFFISCFQRTR